VLAVYCAVAALGGLLIGLGSAPAVTLLRRGPAANDPPSPAPSPAPPPAPEPAPPDDPLPDNPVPDGDALFAGELLDLAYATDLREVRRLATEMALRSGGHLINPAEQTPFDARRHVADRIIRTADAARHGATAGVIRPGLCDSRGVTVRPAVVYRYAWNGRPPDQRP